MNISKRLKEFRVLHNYTQMEVANGILLKRSTYQAYEESRAEPSLSVLLRLASFYGFNSLDTFLGIVMVDPKRPSIAEAYYSAPVDKRLIIDFILNLNAK